jgi:hypothetical protein
MSGRLNGRVSRLENGCPQACPECGGGGAGDGGGNNDTYEVVWVDEAEEEWCETCGRQTAIVVRWPEDLS